MEYRIVAYGPGKECLTWADDSNLDIVKESLVRRGYVDIKTIEDVVE